MIWLYNDYVKLQKENPNFAPIKVCYTFICVSAFILCHKCTICHFFFNIIILHLKFMIAMIFIAQIAFQDDLYLYYFMLLNNVN